MGHVRTVSQYNVRACTKAPDDNESRQKHCYKQRYRLYRSALVSEKLS